MSLQDLVREVENLIEVRKGGVGSGNFGHGGIKGKRGGSTSKGGGSGSSLSPQDSDFINKSPNGYMIIEKLGGKSTGDTSGNFSGNKVNQISSKLEKAGWKKTQGEGGETKYVRRSSQYGGKSAAFKFDQSKNSTWISVRDFAG